jgi:hypothetical protein
MEMHMSDRKKNYTTPGDTCTSRLLQYRLVAVLSVLIVALHGAAIAAVLERNPGRASEGVTVVAQARPDASVQNWDEARISRIESTLESIRETGEKAESRSKTNKQIGAELIQYVKVMVLVLVAIALGFPLSLWLLSKKRLVGLSGLSDEVTATILMVEERQAKLAIVLKEIQGEIDYLHSMSVPDLQTLIQQAESYLKQNEADLEKAGTKRPRKKKES